MTPAREGTPRAPREPFPRLPGKIWVATHEFRLEVVPRSHESLQPAEPGEPDSDGITVFDKQVIFLADDMSTPLELETIWHEITHVVNWVYEIEDGTDEERICDKHGKAWTQFWIANPRFARWWNTQCIALRKAQKEA